MWIGTLCMGALALGAIVSGQYTGPCVASNCGASGKVCPRGYLCVPFPNFNPAERQGCTCSYG